MCKKKQTMIKTCHLFLTFLFFWQTIQSGKQIEGENKHPVYRRMDSNSQPLNYEAPVFTTIPQVGGILVLGLSYKFAPPT